LDRFVRWIGPDRPVRSIVPDDFVYWIAAESERARQQGKILAQSTIRRGLNTIRAALNKAVESGQFHDLQNYRLPRNPLKRSVEKDRDRVLTDDELNQISTKLAEEPKHDEALFFFQLNVITGARMAELLRMKWDESSVRFGTVKLFLQKRANGGSSKRLSPLS
jgi:integrase